MSDKTTVTHAKFFMDLDKELHYINEMNKADFKLVYIKWGMFYTFIKTEPDEYITILHFEDKEKISGVSAFAAQCGYESIPHTMDGLGETLYLTGRKAEVSEDFVNDNEAKIKAYSKIFKKYAALTIVFLIIDLLLIFETVFFIGMCVNLTQSYGFEASDIPFFVFNGFFVVFDVLYTIMGGFVLAATLRLQKKIRAFKNESSIYE